MESNFTHTPEQHGRTYCKAFEAPRSTQTLMTSLLWQTLISCNTQTIAKGKKWSLCVILSRTRTREELVKVASFSRHSLSKNYPNFLPNSQYARPSLFSVTPSMSYDGLNLAVAKEIVEMAMIENIMKCVYMHV